VIVLRYFLLRPRSTRPGSRRGRGWSGRSPRSRPCLSPGAGSASSPAGRRGTSLCGTARSPRVVRSTCSHCTEGKKWAPRIDSGAPGGEFPWRQESRRASGGTAVHVRADETISHRVLPRKKPSRRLRNPPTRAPTARAGTPRRLQAGGPTLASRAAPRPAARRQAVVPRSRASGRVHDPVASRRTPKRGGPSAARR
jgi:hypothetical protein